MARNTNPEYWQQILSDKSKWIDTGSVDAIQIVNKRAVIDQDKCIECGKCSRSCQFNAISDVIRPCIKACKIGALDMIKT
jgi:ferredoxin